MGNLRQCLKNYRNLLLSWSTLIVRLIEIKAWLFSWLYRHLLKAVFREPQIYPPQHKFSYASSLLFAILVAKVSYLINGFAYYDRFFSLLTTSIYLNPMRSSPNPLWSCSVSSLTLKVSMTLQSFSGRRFMTSHY